MPGKKVFLVEDDINLVDLFAEALSLWGFVVEIANQPEAVVTTALVYLPDIILLDGVLQQQNTVPICQELKHQQETQAIPVIFISGHQKVKTWAKEAQADGFLLKPISILDLVAVIQQWVGE
jgi:DNA-binding response OmpR family regulator